MVCKCVCVCVCVGERERERERSFMRVYVKTDLKLQFYYGI